MKIYATLLFAAFLGACAMPPVSEETSGTPNAAVPAGTLSITGQVSFQSLEGGFYGIVANDGKRYDPLNLPAEFRQDGLRIRVTGNARTDVATFRQWGTPLEITTIQRLP